MASVQGYKTRILAGTTHLSCSVRSANMGVTNEILDVTTLCDGPNKAFVFGRSGDGTFSADGPLDTASSTNQPYDVLTAWKGTSVPVTYMPSGDAALAEAFLLDGIQTDFTTSTSPSGTVDFSVAASTTGAQPAGIVLEPLAAVTTTTTGTARDATTAATSGAVFHLHVTTWATLTSNTITVEGSANGTTGWATVATFAVATGVTSQRVSVTGAVARYLRVVDTVVGSGSCTRSVAYARL